MFGAGIRLRQALTLVRYVYLLSIEHIQLYTPIWSLNLKKSRDAFCQQLRIKKVDNSNLQVEFICSRTLKPK